MTSPGIQKEDENESPRKSTDFSIEHILNRAGNSSGISQSTSCSLSFNECLTSTVPFTWLQCSRYCPPKVPRKREGPQKRQLGRHPRIPFSSHQLSILEGKFRQSPYLSSEEVTKLSSILDLADIRVKIWFQNRRARERREKQQSENSLSPNVVFVGTDSSPPRPGNSLESSFVNTANSPNSVSPGNIEVNLDGQKRQLDYRNIAEEIFKS